MDNSVSGISLETEEISQYLEITHPFLMIDRVTDLVPGERAQSVKKLAVDDWFFDCHLKRAEAMPGTLQIEAMLQTLVLTIYTIEDHAGKFSYITDIKTKLFSKVSPGDQLEISAELKSFSRGIAKGIAIGKVNEKTVCRGEFTFISPHFLPHVHG
jgi:3-hydroxyacyl-[acyl-carrier-protein] dehydratase